MPRPNRLTVAGYPHHVIQRGNNRQAIFFEDTDRRAFLSALSEALETHQCALHAYVLMTNHVHLLITPRGDVGLGGTMQALGRRYVGHVNRRYARTGTLWEGRFKSTVVDADSYVLACYRYIEANPVRAAMVGAARDHTWSSHRANAFGEPDRLVTPHECYQALGRSARMRQAAYRTMFENDLPRETIETLRDATQRGWVPGREAFRDQIAAALGRKVTPPVRGRLRKVEDEAAAKSQEQGKLF
jgi:putative transposase